MLIKIAYYFLTMVLPLIGVVAYVVQELTRKCV